MKSVWVVMKNDTPVKVSRSSRKAHAYVRQQQAKEALMHKKDVSLPLWYQNCWYAEKVAAL